MKATLLGQIILGSLILHLLFVITLLLTRREARKDHSLAMVVFFAAHLLNSLGDVVGFFRPALDANATEVIGAPFSMLLGPAVYFYCRALVSPQVLRLARRDLRHLIPFGIGVAMVALTQIALAHTPSVLNPQAKATGATLVVVAAFAVYFSVFISSTSFYVVQVVRLLMRYRRTKFDYFASIEGRSLTWFEWMIGLLSLVWVVNLVIYALALAGLEHLLSPNVQAIIEAIWLYALSFMVLWQQAIFKPYRHGSSAPPAEEGEGESAAPLAAPELGEGQGKYQRSALDEERMRRISAKVERAMAQDQLYRNQNITLRHLSDHTGVSENYLSQVLNHALGRNFYEFINHWRIKEACALLAQQTMSIVEIGEEVGFNARSTFNAAFKKETGLTPSEYRANLRAVA